VDIALRCRASTEQPFHSPPNGLWIKLSQQRRLNEATGKTTAIAVMKRGIKQSIRDHVASLVFGFAPITRTMANVLSEELSCRGSGTT
jgi:hypothetical protein